MWYFYALALPVTLALVVFTLQYFAAPTVSLLVKLVVGYAWFCTIAVIILVPTDIWTTLSDGDPSEIIFLWGWSYWSTFVLTWVVVPLWQGYEDAGDFTVGQRIKASVKSNFILYSSLGVVGFVGVVILVIMGRLKWEGVMGLAMACSNTFGLVTGAFLLGYGLVSVPQSLWRNADLQFRQKWLTHKVVRVAQKLDIAHTELSTAIVIAQATSNQMSRRDPMRPYMDFIDQDLQEMVREDPSFKPSGGRMGESDMDYDTDETSMAELRRRLKKCKENYTRFKSEYVSFVRESLELEDTVKNSDRINYSERRFVSSLRPARTGTLAPVLDTLEWVWRCRIRQQCVRSIAVIMVIMSLAIIAAEATLVFKKGLDLSLFSLLINAVGDDGMSVQIVAFVPLLYMCVCTYYSLVRLGMYTIYYLSPKHTNSVSLLMICSMVARYAAPLSYNYLNLIQLHAAKPTTFQTLMGTMQVLPFLGTNFFQQVYPLFMVIYTGLLASNIFPRLVEYVGGWQRFKVEGDHDQEAVEEGCDPSGLMIIKKERTGVEQGSKIGENVVPLARHFGNVELDVESHGNPEEKLLPDKASSLTMLTKADLPSARDTSTREGIAAKYAALREKLHKTDKDAARASTNPFLSQSTGSDDSVVKRPNDGGGFVSATKSSSFLESGGGLKNTWGNVTSGRMDLQSNIVGKRFAPLRNFEEREPTKPQPSSADTLDSIFQGLKSRKQDDRDDIDLLR